MLFERQFYLTTFQILLVSVIFIENINKYSSIRIFCIQIYLKSIIYDLSRLFFFERNRMDTFGLSIIYSNCPISSRIPKKTKKTNIFRFIILILILGIEIVINFIMTNTFLIYIWRHVFIFWIFSYTHFVFGLGQVR